MSDEINLTSIFNKIIEEKKTMLSIIFAGFILSLIYSLSAEESYKATAHLIPPENKYTQTLNVFLEDGYRLSREEITPSTVFRSLMLNLQSRKYQRKYFFDNKSMQWKQVVVPRRKTSITTAQTLKIDSNSWLINCSQCFSTGILAIMHRCYSSR